MEKAEEEKRGGNASTWEREEQKGDATCEQDRNNKDKIGLPAELPMNPVVLLLESMPASTLGNMACTCHPLEGLDLPTLLEGGRLEPHAERVEYFTRQGSAPQS